LSLLLLAICFAVAQKIRPCITALPKSREISLPLLSLVKDIVVVLSIVTDSDVSVCKFKQDIADAAYRKRRGRPQLPGLGKAIADILFSLLLQGLFLIQV